MRVASLTIMALLAATAVSAQPTSGPAANGSPGWFLQTPPPPRIPNPWAYRTQP
jgi:hypothetical protein